MTECDWVSLCIILVDVLRGMLVIGRLIGQFTCHVIEYHLHELLFKFIFLPKMVQCNALRHEKA